ncbi:MAG: DUF2235 domain-containing protein [Myxococcales bacterium]|nr:DUF2235 domain-containing protein [Myxococcales bacterium]MCB9703706.1 DUF2235 domain-containing protein [Myxococcales bacterium]
MAKKLVLCFDGTWNTPDDDGHDHDEIDSKETNVVRLYRSIRGRDTVGVHEGEPAEAPPVETIKWYDQGVGTHWYDHVRGGAFGFGISRNIRQGYKFLIDHYDPGDEIYIFGFSRGAYSARSLIGLVRNCGLLRREHAPKPDADDNPSVMDAYQLYRNRDGSADTPFAERFRSLFCHVRVPIKMIGVFDTVGSLGIPLRRAGLWSADHYLFHDTRLSGIVEHAYHALSIDEHRREYEPSLWEYEPTSTQTVEQVWFVGAHSDVGGGYPRQPLADLSLAWMQGKALLGGRGLALDPARLADVRGIDMAAATVTDSYGRFMRGLYKLIRGPYLRPIERGPTFAVDESVADKLRRDPGYRPKNPGIAG